MDASIFASTKQTTMARVKINSENQVQRINQMQSRISEIEQLTTKVLVERPA